MENLVNGGNSAVTSCLVTLQEVHDWLLGVGIPPLGVGQDVRSLRGISGHGGGVDILMLCARQGHNNRNNIIYMVWALHDFPLPKKLFHPMIIKQLST